MQVRRRGPIDGERVALGLVLGGHQVVVEREGVVWVAWLIRLAEAEAVVWVEDLHGVGGDALVGTRLVGTDSEAQALAGLPGQRRPAKALEDLPHFGCWIGDAQRPPHAIAGLQAPRDREGQGVREGDVREEVGVAPAQAAGFEVDAAAAVAHRLLGDDVEGAAQGVAAGQAALRPAQEFDALDVHQVHVGAHVAPQVHAVQIDADRRIGGDDVVLQTDAAHEDGGVPGAALAEVGLHHVGGELLDLVELGEAARADAGLIQRGDGGGHVRQCFCPPPRRDDHFLKPRGGRVIAGGGLGQRPGEAQAEPQSEPKPRRMAKPFLGSGHEPNDPCRRRVEAGHSIVRRAATALW